MGVPFHPNLRLLDQRGGKLLLGLTKRRIRRGVFKSNVDLQAAINRYLAEHNANPKPFIWTSQPRTSSPNSTACLYLPYESVH